MNYHVTLKLKSKKTLGRVDRLMAIAAVIHPLMAFPQVYEIYSSQSAENVSLITWLGFMFLGFIFLMYGILHKIKPFIITQVLWFIIDILIVVGVFLYT